MKTAKTKCLLLAAFVIFIFSQRFYAQSTDAAAANHGTFSNIKFEPFSELEDPIPDWQRQEVISRLSKYFIFNGDSIFYKLTGWFKNKDGSFTSEPTSTTGDPYFYKVGIHSYRQSKCVKGTWSIKYSRRYLTNAKKLNGMQEIITFWLWCNGEGVQRELYNGKRNPTFGLWEDGAPVPKCTIGIITEKNKYTIEEDLYHDPFEIQGEDPAKLRILTKQDRLILMKHQNE